MNLARGNLDVSGRTVRHKRQQSVFVDGYLDAFGILRPPRRAQDDSALFCWSDLATERVL
jgi:hypothetical protein